MKLIIGPSCVGKSTYIDQVTHKDSSHFIQYGYQLTDEPLKSDGYVHYNLLHFCTYSNYDNNEEQFLNEPIFKKIFKDISLIEEVIVLVAPVEELLKRAELRTHIEKDLIRTYDKALWLSIIKKINFNYIYYILDKFLRSNLIKTKYLFSSETSNNGFLETDAVFVWKNLLGVYIPVPSKEILEDFASKPEFHYQQLTLPRGVKTNRGSYDHLSKSREETFERFAHLILGCKTILDVGSAIGEFCFFAEKIGCSHIDGVEIDFGRYSASLLAKTMLSSDVNFFNSDFFSFNPKGTYDCVVCLNVIHHVNEFSPFIGKLCSLTSKYLILEFPTLEDSKFLNAHNITYSSFLDSLPLVGVSSKTIADQFYVFTPKAVESIIANIDSKFILVEVLKSPINARKIMVFKK